VSASGSITKNGDWNCHHAVIRDGWVTPATQQDRHIFTVKVHDYEQKKGERSTHKRIVLRMELLRSRRLKRNCW